MPRAGPCCRRWFECARRLQPVAMSASAFQVATISAAGRCGAITALSDCRHFAELPAITDDLDGRVVDRVLMGSARPIRSRASSPLVSRDGDFLSGCASSALSGRCWSAISLDMMAVLPAVQLRCCRSSPAKCCTPAPGDWGCCARRRRSGALGIRCGFAPATA